MFLITIPFWSNLLIRTLAIMFIIRDEGIINNMLLGLGVIEKPITMLYTNFAILLGLLYSFLPFMVLPIYASLEKLDFRLVEAGYDLYATRRQVLWRMIIPLSQPGIIAGCLLVFIPALGAYVTPLILGGGKHLMIGDLIALQFGSGPQLAARLRAGADPDGGGPGRALLLCAQHLGQGAAWLSAARRRHQGPARLPRDRHRLASSCSICRS